MKRANLRIRGIEEKEKKPRSKAQKIFFKKYIVEKFPTLNKEMPIKIQEVYKTPNRLGQKINFPQHVTFKTEAKQEPSRGETSNNS